MQRTVASSVVKLVIDRSVVRTLSVQSVMHVCSSPIHTVSSLLSNQGILLTVVLFLACDDLRPITMTSNGCWERSEATLEWQSDDSPQYGDWGSNWVPEKESSSSLPTIPGVVPGEPMATPDEMSSILEDEISDLLSISDDSSF